MKRLIAFIIMLAFCFPVFSQDTKDFKINKKWIEVKRRSRTYFQKRELLELDKQTVEILQNSTISADVESDLSDLLYEIIVYDALDAKETSIKAFELLEKKFSDKKYFYRIASDFSANYAEKYPVLIAQIFLSMKNLIKMNLGDNVKVLSKIYEYIKSIYISGSREGTQKYRTDVVVKSLKEYLAEFDRLLKAKEIETDTPYEQEIIKIKIDLQKYLLM